MSVSVKRTEFGNHCIRETKPTRQVILSHCITEGKITGRGTTDQINAEYTAGCNKLSLLTWNKSPALVSQYIKQKIFTAITPTWWMRYITFSSCRQLNSCLCYLFSLCMVQTLQNIKSLKNCRRDSLFLRNLFVLFSWNDFICCIKYVFMHQLYSHCGMHQTPFVSDAGFKDHM